MSESQGSAAPSVIPLLGWAPGSQQLSTFGPTWYNYSPCAHEAVVFHGDVLAGAPVEGSLG